MLVEQTAISFSYPTHSRRRDPATSHDAAESMERTGTATRHMDMIVDALHMLRGGGTAPDIAMIAGLDSVQVSRRMADLMERGDIEDYRNVPRREWPRRNGYTVWRLA